MHTFSHFKISLFVLIGRKCSPEDFFASFDWFQIGSIGGGLGAILWGVFAGEGFL